MLLPPIAIAIAAVVFLDRGAQPVYSAEAEVVIRTQESANLFPLSEIHSLLRSPSVEQGFLSSTGFETVAMEAAGSNAPVRVDVGDVNSRVEPSFITFRATAASPERAASTAQAWAQTYMSMRHELDQSEIQETIETLSLRLDRLSLERDELLTPVHALDQTLERTSESAHVAQISTRRLVLMQSLESALAPIEAQTELVSDELAQLQLIDDFLARGEISARVNRIAEVPQSPLAASLPRNLVIGILAALAVGMGAVMLVHSLDDRVRTTQSAARYLGLQNLAAVPHRRRDDQDPTPAFGPLAESFHRLASSIDFAALTGSQAKVLMFTSAHESASKTTTVSRLATTLARQGRRTLIIGGDLRRPSLSKRFDHPLGPGLGELLGGLYPFSTCAVEVEGHDGLWLLPAGTVATESSPVDLLRTDAFLELIEEIRSDFDHIIIDCPPVLPVVDALEITRVCDAIVMCLFAGTSRLGRVERALSMIHHATRKPLLGFVLTGIKEERDSYGGGYYGDRRTSDLLDLRRSATTPAPQSAQVPALVGVGRAAEEADASSSMPPPVVGEAEDDGHGPVVITERETSTEVVSSKRKGKKRMRALRNLFLMCVALTSIAVAAPAGAQYEGDSTDNGVLTVPVNPGPGDPLGFVITGLQPNSELTFELFADDGGSVDGLGVSVQGAVAVRVGADGRFDGDIDIPAGLADGIYTLTVTGTTNDGGSYVRTFAIQIGDGAVTNAADTVLALTGSSARSTALNGVLIIVVGAALVAFAARRQESTPVTTNDS